MLRCQLCMYFSTASDFYTLSKYCNNCMLLFHCSIINRSQKPICIGSGQKVISWLANDDRGNRRGRWGRGGESDLFVSVVVNAVIVAEEAVTKNPYYIFYSLYFLSTVTYWLGVIVNAVRLIVNVMVERKWMVKQGTCSNQFQKLLNQRI